MTNNKIMEDYIKDWGLPEVLKGYENEVVYKFTDEETKTDCHQGLHCRYGSVKFSLYDETKQKVLFTMDFFLPGRNPKIAALRAAGSSETCKSLELNLLDVELAGLRKKGIASFYLNKLKEYAIQENANRINIMADAENEYFKEKSKENGLSQINLEKFYRKRSSIEMPIVIKQRNKITDQ